MKYREYLQIPYQHQGRTFQGCDCYGILFLFYQKEFNVELPIPAFDYEIDWWKENNHFMELYKQYSFKPVKDAPRFGDVILFRNNNEHPGHIGIVLDDNNFMHMTNSGTNITTYTFGPWARQVHSRYRYVKRRTKC